MNICKNASDAFINVIEVISDEGEYISTRGNDQKEILSYLLKIENPKERVIILKRRNNNIFALIAETMWVLGGRDDLQYLSRYLPRAIDFSDDGLVWRAAYGPRLRNWDGVDQFKNIARIINEDHNTKRAVMTIFNPKLDYVETKDVPCNNWLHFIERNGELNLNVCVRANDAVWGFGGINSFEWSTLLEMMANWTGNKIGTLSWFVGSFHVYSRHYKTVENILKENNGKTVYDYGISSPKFTLPIDCFDEEMNKWFELEEKIRTVKDKSNIYLVDDLKDDLMKESMKMLYIYNLYLNNGSKEDIIDLLEEMETSDFKMGALEYFYRIYGYGSIKLNEIEKSFFDDYFENISKERE